MPMSTNMREYVAQGNAAPGPDAPHDKGGKLTVGSWKSYNNGEWGPLPTQPSRQSFSPSTMTLVTWNVDGWAPNTHERVTGILARIAAIFPEVILLQELSGPATRTLLATPFIQENYYTCEDTPEADDSGVPIVQITLVSRTFGTVGDVFQISLPSRYERVLVCSDVHVTGGRIRMVNVHLDSLAQDPSFRPVQVTMAAEMVREHCGGGPGVGIIAGDWNPVLPIDHTLVAENGLVDAWEAVKGKADGFTWNWDGRSKEPFPPQRLDKVAVLGLKPVEIEVLEPGTLENGVDWSDHCGLFCRIELPRKIKAGI